MKKYFNLILPLFIAQVTLASETKRIVDLKDQESQVEFLAIGKPSLLKINGKDGKLSGKVELNNNFITGEFIVALESLSTGITLRDEHMKKKYLQTDQFPNAVLRITDLKLEKDPLKFIFTTKNIPFKGKLKIHDTESDVEGSFDIESNEKTIVVMAKTKTNISAHKIDIPSYVGVKVTDEIEISTTLKIVK